jgi:hypothetical protein
MLDASGATMSILSRFSGPALVPRLDAIALGLKMLVWTHGGFLMLYKRLEKGRFRWPSLDGDRGTISQAELAALMEGIDLSNARRLKRWNPRKVRGQADPAR